MDFLAADVAAMREPNNADLTGWFAENSDRFAIPRRASFRHLYFSPDERGVSARDDAVATLKAIEGKPANSVDVAALADPFMLRSYYRNSTPDLVLKEFGPSFAAQLFELDPGGWRGPIQSGYGWHLVRIDAMEPGRIPAFEEVEAEVRSAWYDARYQEIKRAALEEMRSRYTVVVAPLDTIDMNGLDSPAPGNTLAQPASQ